MTIDARDKAEATVAFRVLGLHLDPDQVSYQLGWAPTNSHKRGDPNFGKSGRRYSDYSEGLWLRQISLTGGESMEHQIQELLSDLWARRDSLEKLRAAGLRLDISIGVFGAGGNVGFSIGHDIARQLGELSLALEFDVYC